MTRLATRALLLLFLLRAANPTAADELPLPVRVQSLLRLVDDGHANQWSTACDTLVAIGPAARPAVKPLLAIAADKWRNPYRRSAALLAASELAPDDSAVYRTMIALLSEPDSNIRMQAADRLQRLYSHRPDVAKLAVPALVKSWQKYPTDATFACLALYDFGPLAASATDELIAMLAPSTEPDPGPNASEWDRRMFDSKHLRGMQAKILGRIGLPAKAAIPRIAKLLSSKSKYDRSDAAEALADFGPLAVDAIPELVKAAADPDRKVQYRVMYALGRIGFTEKASLPAFAEPPQPDAATLRFAFVVGQAVSRPNPVPQLLEAIKSREQVIRTHALAESRKLSRAAAPAFIAELQNKDRHIRWAAASVIGDFGGRIYYSGAGAAFWASADGRTAEAGLIALLSDSEPTIRDAAALNLMPSRSGRTLAALQNLAGSPHWYDRATAVVALQGFRGTLLAGLAIETISAALSDPVGYVRYSAAGSLRHYGPAAKSAVPQLIAAIDDERGLGPLDWPPPPTDASPEEKKSYDFMKGSLLFTPTTLRQGPIRALGAIGPDARAAVPGLKKRLQRFDIGWIAIPDFGLCRDEIETLGKIGPDAAETIPLLLRRLRQTTHEWHVAEAIACMGEKGATALVPLLQTDESAPMLQYTASAALSNMGRPAAIKLVPMLSSPDQNMRDRAGDVLKRLGDRASPAAPSIAAGWLAQETSERPGFETLGPAMVTALVDLLSTAKPEQRDRICQAIETFGPDGALAVPRLVELVTNSDRRVRIAAAQALGRIGSPARTALPALRKMTLHGSTAEIEAASDAVSAIVHSPAQEPISP